MFPPPTIGISSIKCVVLVLSVMILFFQANQVERYHANAHFRTLLPFSTTYVNTSVANVNVFLLLCLLSHQCSYFSPGWLYFNYYPNLNCKARLFLLRLFFSFVNQLIEQYLPVFPPPTIGISSINCVVLVLSVMFILFQADQS